MRPRRVLPGFGLTLGFSVLYLSLIVLIPLSATFFKTAGMEPARFWETVTSPRAIASYRLTFGASFAAALINAVAGLGVAWTLTRYRFPGRNLLDAMVDLPFALPTAVAGIALTTLYAPPTDYSPGGWIGRWLPFQVAYTPLGVTLALFFIGLPFVVRTIQPVLADLGPELEEAALSLGAGGWQTFRRVVFPEVFPALLTGFALAFARAIGEYGSVVFIAANLPYKTEITPLLIMARLEQTDYQGATALAVVMLVISFALLLVINLLQKWAGRGRSIA